MPVRISYSSNGRGNTIPYPPLRDEIRRNYGFIDLRGRPDAVATIPEAQLSSALTELLVVLAQPRSALISLGCDLGEHTDPTGQSQTRRRAGGYVQLADGRMRDEDRSLLKRLSAHIGATLEAAVGNDRWSIRFDLSGVAYSFDEIVKAHSLWIWFDAKASTLDKARVSRERLLTAITSALSAFEPQHEVEPHGTIPTCDLEGVRHRPRE